MTQKSDPRFQPISGFDLPRFAGVPTFMRLPYISADDPDYSKVDIGIIGVPWDCLLYTSPSPRDLSTSRMPSSA